MRRRPAKGRIARDETFDEFLHDQGLLAEAEETAIKELIAEQIQSAMTKEHVTKTAMAARMKTSRRQLDRLLDPSNPRLRLLPYIGRRWRSGES
jgi:hypothetical protein